MLITINGRYDLVGLFSFTDLLLMLVYGPLIYLYCRSVIYKNFTFERRQLWHFGPFIVLTILSTINYMSVSEEQKLEALQKIYTHKLSFGQAMMVLPFYLHILVYIVLSFGQVKVYRRVISEDFSDLKPYSMDWLIFLIRSFFAITLISMFLSIFPYTEFKQLSRYALAADIILTFFIINQIVFKALKQPDLFSGIEEPKKYYKSSLTDIDKEAGRSDIERLMLDDKPYLDPNLSLEALAEMLGMKKRDVSQIINEEMNLSFHDYINRERINHAKQIMSGSDPKITVLEVLYQSGFNSKSSFNAAFKKQSSQTPTEYRRSLLNK